MDFDRIRDELGTAGFQKKLQAEPAFMAAWQAWRASRQQDSPPAELQPGYPRNLWRVSPEGYGFPMIRIPVKQIHAMRAVGDLYIVKRHWWKGGDNAVCLLNADCEHCPATNRKREGYFDAIAKRVNRGQTEIYRGIGCVPRGAIDSLLETRPAGARVLSVVPLRGAKIEFFRKTQTALTQATLSEEECPFELPPAIDIRLPLIRLWELPFWPREPGDRGEDDENILKFRRQA